MEPASVGGVLATALSPLSSPSRKSSALLKLRKQAEGAGSGPTGVATLWGEGVIKTVRADGVFVVQYPYGIGYIQRNAFVKSSRRGRAGSKGRYGAASTVSSGTGTVPGSPSKPGLAGEHAGEEFVSESMTAMMNESLHVLTEPSPREDTTDGLSSGSPTKEGSLAGTEAVSEDGYESAASHEDDPGASGATVVRYSST